jgi:hypothetical protein
MKQGKQKPKTAVVIQVKIILLSLTCGHNGEKQHWALLLQIPHAGKTLAVPTVSRFITTAKAARNLPLKACV